MIKRKIMSEIERFFNNHNNKALLITGARQVGKTYIIREFGKRFESFVEINLLENKLASNIIKNSSDSKELLMSLSAITTKPLIPGKTLIFFDEVQECNDIVTAIKFLVEEGSYQYILSGSLLGVELKNVRSIPVGYMGIIEMYPLDLEEFIIANGFTENLIDTLRDNFNNATEVNAIIHQKMMQLFKAYLIVGGMPKAVDIFLKTNNLQEVANEQKSIILLYKNDISKYDPDNISYINDIFDLIPSELNNKNKRFIMKDLNETFKLSRYYNSFIWLKDAGVALPTYSTNEPKSPLLLNKKSRLFKLFLSDVGLLVSMYGNNIQLSILNNEKNINFGAIYENVVAQELKSHDYELYYFNNKKQGEIDFVIEDNNNITLLEVKSGKDYTAHSALNKALADKNYSIQNAYVLYNGNIKRDGRIIYYPIYMTMFIKKPETNLDFIYKIDLEELK